MDRLKDSTLHALEMVINDAGGKIILTPEDIESCMGDANSAYFMGGCASQEDYDYPDMDDCYYNDDDY